MRARDEVEAAYFALLRAREDLENLHRFRDYLGEEIRRLRRFVAEGSAHADEVDKRLRLRLVHTQQPLDEAIVGRIETCADELARMGDRIEAAEAYVNESEASHDRLRANG
jgi:hypothetical protein